MMNLITSENHARFYWRNNMNDFTVLVGCMATASIAINIYLIKSVANLCEKVGRLEGKLSRS